MYDKSPRSGLSCAPIARGRAINPRLTQATQALPKPIKNYNFLYIFIDKFILSLSVVELIKIPYLLVSTRYKAHQRADVEPASDTEREKTKNYLRSIREFVCAQAFKSTAEVKEAAGNVIVDMETWETIKEMYLKIEARLYCKEGQVGFEFWKAFDVKKTTSQLGKIHAEALFAYSSIDPNVDLAKLFFSV